VDAAPNQVAFARARKLNVIHADATELPFENDSFSLCFSGEVIEHLNQNDGEKMLREIHRVLQPHGRIVITTPNYQSLWPVFEKIWSRIGPIDLCSEHLTKYNRQLFSQILEKNGFQLTGMSTLFLASPFVGFFPQLARELEKLEKNYLTREGMILLATAVKV
jgi:ubiquinone/menaquinone biosynthesis C-methylase UbiE